MHLQASYSGFILSKKDQTNLTIIGDTDSEDYIKRISSFGKFTDRVNFDQQMAFTTYVISKLEQSRKTMHLDYTLIRKVHKRDTLCKYFLSKPEFYKIDEVNSRFEKQKINIAPRAI